MTDRPSLTLPRVPYQPGIVGIEAIATAAEADPARVMRLIAFAEAGLLTRAITPASIAGLLDEADAWVMSEAEVGHDLTPADLAAAGRWLSAISQAEAPDVAAVPPSPSPS